MEIIGNIILGLLSTYYIVSGLTMIIMSLKTIKDIKNAKNSKIKLKNNYYIILPVLKEQNIIVESIDYFYDLTKYEEKVKVFVITTEREDDEYIKNPKYTTYDIAKNKINKLGIQDKIILLKDGRECCLRNGTENDAQEVLDVFNLTHAETDYLLTYPDENSFTVEQESSFLKAKTESSNEIEIIAVVDGKIAGTAGIDALGNKYKTKHRAEFGIGIAKEFWGLGIGRALTEACIECAKEAGYTQLELDVVSDNASAISLYKKVGFVEYGRNPKGFNSRISGYQELIYMKLDL